MIFFFLINLFIYLFIYLLLCWVFVAVHGLIIAVASLVAEHGLYLGAWASVVVACGLSSCASRALERRLSSCGARA